MRHLIAIAVAIGLVGFCGRADAQQQYDAGGRARVSSSGSAVAGAQIALAINSATAPTVPAGANTLVIQANGTNNGSGQCLLWRDDGTNPTGTTGISMAAGGSPVTYKVSGTPIKFIQATGATCTVTIFYYQ